MSGLFFSSHEVIQDKRTSLNLTVDKPYKFPQGFSLEFDANFRKGDGYYGYIFRIIGDNKTNIDLVSNLEPNTTPNFYLVLKDKVLFSYKWSEIPNGGFNRWLKIRIDIDVRNSKLIISLNGNKQEVVSPDILGLKDFNVGFGACKNINFSNTDVSPMSLKDIRLFNSKNDLLHEWKLSKHGENVVYDEDRKLQARVENPIWIIDKHVRWKTIKQLKIDNILGITKDEERGIVFFVSNNSVYMLSTQTGLLDTIPFAGGLPFAAMDKQIIYNKFTNELWSYNFDSSEISKFSFITNKWSVNGTIAKEPDFWHHNKFISPIDTSLVTLMGYGFYTYKSVINRYDTKLKVWNKIDRSDQIQPRYLSGTGFLNNREMLVFGGYGSNTGRQELSPEYYYDLYSLNLNDFTFKKLWTLDTPSAPFVPVEDLVIDQQGGSFYTLVYSRASYKTFLRLVKFGIIENEYQLYNDSIPFSFLDIESWNTLFLDKKASQIVAVTSHNSDISIHTIAFPPLMPEEAFQQVVSKKEWNIWFIISAALLLTGLNFVVYLKFRKRKVKSTKETLADHFEKLNISPVISIERKTQNAIYFLGGFQIYNNKGDNITSSFSPTLKQLFVFIFLYTNKNGKGVSSIKLDEVLWYDKSGESARNNRNVNISKLRTILSDVDGIELVNENTYWKITMEEPVYIDYIEILQLFRKSKSDGLTSSEINNLIALLNVGEFLPGLQTEWIDKFKSQFAEEMTDGITSLLKEKYLNENHSLLYHLSDCILLHEPLNDEALAMKCSVLNSFGHHDRALKTYNSFCKEYKKALGTNYAVSFKEIIYKQ